MHEIALRCRSGRVGSLFASMTAGLFKTRSSNRLSGMNARPRRQQFDRQRLTAHRRTEPVDLGFMPAAARHHTARRGQ